MSPKEVLKFYAFSSPEGGGNPAGVVLNADALSELEMQAIAKDAGYSETVFVSKSKLADFRLDFFTPTRRIADCGHATVAAFGALKQHHPELAETSKEIVSGTRKIVVDGSMVFMEQPIPSRKAIENCTAVFSRFFPSSSDPVGGWILRHDVGYALFEVASESDLASLQPDFREISSFSEDRELVGLYLFAKKQSGSALATTRMFAPAYGIQEESATGMAAGLLASHLSPAGDHDFVIEQGQYMTPASPSLIFCKVRPTEGRVLVGGAARRA